MRIKILIVGFFLSAVLFVSANIYSYYTVVPPCCDFYCSFGFPLPLGEYGGFVGDTIIYQTGLIEDALIGVGASLIFAGLFTKSFPMLTKLWLALSNSVATSLTKLRSWHLSTRL